MRFSAISLALLLAGTSVQAQVTVEWTHDFEAPPGAPTLYPNAQHPTGFVVAAGQELVLFRGNGEVVWQTTEASPLATPATVADLDGNDKPEIVYSLSNGDLVCRDREGKERWRRAIEGPVGGFKMAVAADVLPTPGLELLVGYNTGWLHCFGAKGELLWRFFGDRYRVGPRAVADVDADGAPEIVLGTDNGHIYCLNGQGQVEWRYDELAPYGRSGVNIADLEGDGKAEVLITRSNVGIAPCLMALDGASGKFLWRTRDVLHGYVSNATVDMDGDGTLETLHCDKANWLYCVNADGTERWRCELSGRGIFWAPVAVDMDGDGRLEAILGVRNSDPETGANVYVVDDDGSVLERIDLGASANSGFAAGDIDGDGEVEVIASTEGPSRVQVLTWKRPGRVGWPSLRGNSGMVGSAGNVSAGIPGRLRRFRKRGKIKARFDDVFLGQNRWKLSWKKPVPKSAFLEISARAEAGAHETWIVDLKEGSTTAEPMFNLVQPAENEITVRLMAAGVREPIAARRWKETTRPADFCDFARVKRLCGAAMATGERRGSDVRGLRAWLALLEAARGEVLNLAKSGGDRAVIAVKATELRNQSADLLALVNTLTHFWKDGGSGSFVVWQDRNPWDAFDPAAVPERFGSDISVSLTAFGNEFEDLSLNLLNITSEPVDVRCIFTPPEMTNQRPRPEPKLARHITLRRSLRVPSTFSGMRVDPLPELDRSRAITLPPGEARQLWLVVNTRGLEAGEHEITLHLGSLSQNPTFRQVRVKIEVWPVALPEGVYAKMNWSRADAGRVSDQALQDMIDHGVNVFYGPNVSIQVDSAGNLAASVDWTHFDATLDRLPPHSHLLWGAPPARNWPAGVKVEPFDERWNKGFRTGLRVLARHLAERGMGYDRWALYPIDEPWLTGFTHIPYLRRFAQTVKWADPKARVYADPAGLVRSEYLEEFKDLIDVWQPEMNLLKRDPKLVAWFRENADDFWTYEAAGPGKDLLPLGHYRAFHWLAWMFGAEGSGYWVYRALDLWWPKPIDTWSAVYQTDDEVVPSRRWEASRDGVEDYRALYLMREEIRNARVAGYMEEAQWAQRLIDEAVENLVGWNARNIDEITRMTRDYEIDFDMLMDYRKRIAEEIIRLRSL